MEGNPTFLTLKEASARLGVHPNTLRNWEQRGLVHLARLPGSRYRRVPVYEVQRLAQEMEEERPAEIAPSGATRAVETAVTEIGRVRIEHPNTDPVVVAAAQALAERIKAELAATEPEMTLEETMQTLRGWSWLS